MVPEAAFTAQVPPPRPDYSKEDAWAAHPKNEDCSDVNPPGLVEPDGRDDYDNKFKKNVDVFYLHPSTFYSSERWNSAYNDPFVRFMTDDAILTQQGSAFNGAGQVYGAVHASNPKPNPSHNPKVYAPRWRQMTAWGYFAEMEDREAAMNVAYGDVERAWLYYVKHYNPGLTRPFIIAGHSQGTEHAVRLLKKYRDSENGNFKGRLIAAYLVGSEVYPSHTGFEPCEKSTSTSCIVGWRSYGNNVNPKVFRLRPAFEALRTGNAGEALLCVNPLSWKHDNLPAPASMNPGTMHILQWWQNLAYLAGPRANPHGASLAYHQQVQASVDRARTTLLPLEEGVVGAQCHDGTLLVDEPDFYGYSYFTFPVHRFASFPGRNYHSYDMVFYYKSLWRNAKERAAAKVVELLLTHLSIPKA